jgi:autotransporter-associated beta strand protein
MANSDLRSGVARGHVLTCILILFWIAVQAHAGPVVADATWTSTTGGNWSDGTKWSTNPDYPSGVGAIARFTNIQTANRAFLVDVDVILSALTIDNAMSRTNTIGVLNPPAGSPEITFDAPGTGPATITITGNSSGSATPNNMFAPVILNDSLVVTVDRTSSTSVAGTLTFRQGPLTGAGGITKEGPGILTLADNHKAYTGATVVNTGRLRINVPAGTPNATSGVIINGVGQLDLAGIGDYSFGAAPITLNGPGPANNFPLTFGGTIRVDGAGSNSIASDIVVQSPSSIHVQGAANTTELKGVVSGPGSLTLPPTGSDGNIGTLVLSGANTYSGGTIINDGTVTVNSPTGLGAATGPLAVNNQNNTQAGTNVALNLFGGAPTTTGSLSGTIATPTTGVNTVTIHTNGQTLTVNQSTPGTFAGSIADGGGLTLGALSSEMLTLSGANTYTGATTVAAGTLKVTGSIAGSSGVTVTGGTFDAAATQTVHALTVGPAGIARVTRAGAAAPATVLAVGDNSIPLPLSVLGKLDLTTNGLAVFDTANAASLAIFRTSVISAYAGGTWAGNGVTSSSAAGTSNKGVGYAMGNEIFGPGGGTFMGAVAVDGSAILARFTLLGDATLDGTVDFNDLVRLAQNYNRNLALATDSWWYNGDFTYDGMVDFNDLVKLAQNYNGSVPAGAIPGVPAEFEGDLARALAAVPEPSSVAALATIAALRRRRSRQDLRS